MSLRRAARCGAVRRAAAHHVLWSTHYSRRHVINLYELLANLHRKIELFIL